MLLRLLEVKATGWSLPTAFGWRSAPPRPSSLSSTWSTRGIPSRVGGLEGWRVGAVASKNGICFYSDEA